jgi:hypothetical protein
MSYKLYLDDIRMPHVSAKKFPHLAELYNDPTWVIVRNYDDFVLLIRNRWEKLKEAPAIISFDHDLGPEHTKYFFDNGGRENPPNPDDGEFTEKTGKDCANWLVDFCETKGMPLPEFYIHSANPVGGRNIESLLTQYKKFLRQVNELE